jgi:hypothetical protein
MQAFWGAGAVLFLAAVLSPLEVRYVYALAIPLVLGAAVAVRRLEAPAGGLASSGPGTMRELTGVALAGAGLVIAAALAGPAGLALGAALSLVLAALAPGGATARALPGRAAALLLVSLQVQVGVRAVVAGLFEQYR